MLQSLHIENFAVIKSIDIEFSSGFMVLTGETGSGKSVIIDSIGILLGAKADRELIRNGENHSTVSGIFSDLSENTVSVLIEHGIFLDEDKNLLIQRSIFADGKSNIKINGRTVTLTVLRSISPTLISIHTQGDTAMLSVPEEQLSFIDFYSDNTSLLKEYKEAYSRLSELNFKLNELKSKKNERERLIEILDFQIKDIDSLKLQPNEEDKLIDKKLKIKNSEKINKNAGFAYKALKGSEKGSVAFLLDRSATALNQISNVIPQFSKYSEQLRDYLYQIEDISEEVYSVIADMEDDCEESLNQIESRLDKISKLKRKYGYTVEEVLKYRDEKYEELQTLKNADDIIDKTEKEVQQAYEIAFAIAKKLHANRETASAEIEVKVKEILEFLDMPNVVFFAKINKELSSGKVELNPFGFDKLEFYISANKGAEPQPLAKIASGGELARVMLALKSIITDKDGISTVIFDEIDTGVSGKTARKIGLKMLMLSKNVQIFSVTHSAQIASVADLHYLIGKTDVNGKTETYIKALDYDGRVNELSRILGGINVTDAQRNAAIDMIKEHKSF